MSRMGKENSLRTHIFEIVKIHFNSNSNVLITLSSSSRKFDRSNNGNKRRKKTVFFIFDKEYVPRQNHAFVFGVNMLYIYWFSGKWIQARFRNISFLVCSSDHLLTLLLPLRPPSHHTLKTFVLFKHMVYSIQGRTLLLVENFCKQTEMIDYIWNSFWYYQFSL